MVLPERCLMLNAVWIATIHRIGLGMRSACSTSRLQSKDWLGYLGHLECDVAAVADDLRTDLDQFLLQAR